MSAEVAAACCCGGGPCDPCVPVGLIGSLRGLVTDIDCGLAPSSGDTMIVIQHWDQYRANEGDIGIHVCCSWCDVGNCDSGAGFSSPCGFCDPSTLMPPSCSDGVYYWRDLIGGDCVAGACTDPCPPRPQQGLFECLGYWGNGSCLYMGNPEGGMRIRPRPDIPVLYSLLGCRWLWWSRIYSIGLDPMIPSSNTGICNALPDQCPSTTGCSNCTSEAKVGAFCRCCHTANPGFPCSCMIDYWSMGRSYPYDTLTGQVVRLGGSSHIPWYPPSLPSEVSCDNNGGVWNTATASCNIAGLSPYQVRVAQQVAPWTWEIVMFNGAQPVTVRTRVGAGAWTLHRTYFDTIGHRSTIDGDAVPEQPLFVRLHTWVGCEAHWRVCGPSYPDPTQIPGMPTLQSAALLPRTVPRGLGFTHDAVPLFTFVADTELTSTVATSMVNGFVTPTTSYTQTFIDSVNGSRSAINAALGSGAFDCKDWRGEIHSDLTLVAAWGTSVGWSVPANILASFPSAASLKPVGPVRVRGDRYDIRSEAAPTARPPSLAACDTHDASAQGSWWWLQDGAIQYSVGPLTQNACGNGPDYGGSLQTDASIYLMAEPPGGVGSMPSVIADAWYRLTQSVYFRSMPIGWRVLSLSAPTTQAVLVDGQPFYFANGIYDAGLSTDFSISSHAWTQSTDWTDNTTFAIQHSWRTYSGGCPVDPTSITQRDFQWCSNGVPYGLDHTLPAGFDLRCDCTGIPFPPDPSKCEGGPIACAICDCQYGHPGIAGNPHAIVQRHCFPHVQAATTCCTPAFLGDNYCWARHSRRCNAWQCASIPFGIVTVDPATHPIDRADYECIIPPVQARCESCNEPSDCEPSSSGQLNYLCDCADVHFTHRNYRAICAEVNVTTGMEQMYLAQTHTSDPNLPHGYAATSIWARSTQSMMVPAVALTECNP